jgi:hypothetical protein
MKCLLLAAGASLTTIAGLAAGCGGNAFTTGSGVVDAAVEAAPIDAGPEAAPDAAPPVDAGPSWCATHPATFCEDFDEYPNVGSLLDMTTWPVNVQQSGSFAFDTLDAPSPPNALQVAGDDGAEVIIVKSFPALQKVPTKITLTFDLRINSPGAPGLLSAAGFAAIAFGNSINDGYVAMAIGDGPTLAALWVESTTTMPMDAGAFKATPAMGAFPSTGIWLGSFSVEVDYNPPSPPCLQVYRVQPLLSSCVPLPPEFANPTVLSIVLGDVAGGTGHTGTVEVEFDNVLFNVDTK